MQAIRKGWMGTVLIAGLLTTAGASPIQTSLTRFTYTEYLMGVDARLIVYAPDKVTAEKACAAAFERIAQLDAMMSDYRQDSELMRLCDKAGGPPVRISPELMKVFKRAREVSDLTAGVFDITVGPLVQLWRAARKSAVLPSPSEIEAARKLVGWDKVVLDERHRTAQLLVPGMKLDLGGIAKGYADDEAQKVLRKHGIASALVEMGGDIVVSDAPPGTDGWTIQVPNAEGGDKPSEIHLKNCAISSSGDTEQFVIIGGKRYSHVVNPITGWAETDRAQVTVIARDGLTSDPLTKAMLLIGDEGFRRRLLRRYRGARAYRRVIHG